VVIWDPKILAQRTGCGSAHCEAVFAGTDTGFTAESKSRSSLRRAVNPGSSIRANSRVRFSAIASPRSTSYWSLKMFLPMTLS